MTQRERREREACAHKIRHETWEDARTAGLLVSQENPKGVNAPTPYPCAAIGEPHYHCGHLSVRRKRWRTKVRAA